MNQLKLEGHNRGIFVLNQATSPYLFFLYPDWNQFGTCLHSCSLNGKKIHIESNFCSWIDMDDKILSLNVLQTQIIMQVGYHINDNTPSVLYANMTDLSRTTTKRQNSLKEWDVKAPFRVLFVVCLLVYVTSIWHHTTTVCPCLWHCYHNLYYRENSRKGDMKRGGRKRKRRHAAFKPGLLLKVSVFVRGPFQNLIL